MIQSRYAPAISHVSPFALEINGFGVFPDNRSSRVLWIGLGGALDSLDTLAGADRFNSISRRLALFIIH